ncbi:hypothetical protein C8A01DRAFT_12922, partial [Parachaetomium inaequale]
PPDFVLPPGPKIVVVRVDRDALQHLNPSMDPLTDDDGPSRVLRKGKTALDQARLELSVELFDDDFPCLASRTVWPQPGVSATTESVPFLTKYVGFYFKHDVTAGDLRPAIFMLTSEGDPVDNCIRFHAVEVAEHRKDGVLENVRFIEEAIMGKGPGKDQVANLK